MKKLDQHHFDSLSEFEKGYVKRKLKKYCNYFLTQGNSIALSIVKTFKASEYNRNTVENIIRSMPELVERFKQIRAENVTKPRNLIGIAEAKANQRQEING